MKIMKILAGVIVLLSATAASAETFVDDAGRTVELQLPIKRAVIFNRYAVEFARAIGAIDQVVGVDASTMRDKAYWPQFNDSDIVGQGQSDPNYEAIVALDPDVVIMPRNGVYEEAARQLAPFGIPVMVVTAWDTLEHVDNVTTFGKLFGKEQRAADLVAYYTGYMDLLHKRLEGVEPKRVYFEEVRNYVTVTPGSGWHDMIEAGGGVNIFGDIDISKEPSSRGNENSFTIDPEEIIARKPDVVIKLQPGAYQTIPVEKFETAWDGLVERQDIQGTPAYRNSQLHLINYYLAGGSSKITGALQIAKWLYPARFEDIDPEAAMKQWIEDFQGLPFQAGMTYQQPTP
ncbi:ABC transporter substrate-binding protein [Martelella sp. HB161492]|uniref:ABC transporter substrate-binding protein n=1 Tax=Martelella sp. HB161492 TaxID=2720726 RepID=UPI001AEDCA36|nr:ABC transporter substrate-binding protein [Martelella sp. HB161492]